MTRLTDEQIREAWDEPMMADHVPKWDQLPILWFDKNRNFAHRIAALAVQEVEREHDARTFELECAKGDIATLTAQLAEARQSIAEEEARADAIAAHRDALLAAYQSVREERDALLDLHRPFPRAHQDGGGEECTICYDENGVPVNYPCATVRILRARTGGTE